jgi:hypothetical protein
MHTHYSDGTGSHQDIADAAIEAELDVVIITDHNQLVLEKEGYYETGNRKVLLLVGEEIHDRDRNPEKNHLLVFGINQDLADKAKDPNQLINAVHQNGGVSFLAHPIDPAAPLFNEADYSWEDWNVSGFTGIELWNGFSEFKTRLTSKAEAIFYAYLPKRIARGPLPETLVLWDRLTSSGKKVVSIGGSDAHARAASLGPLKRTVFPYLYHFRCINTHLILPSGLSGNLEFDKTLIINAMRQGHGFVGYDLPHSTKGFQFSGFSEINSVIMGDDIRLGTGVTLEIKLPYKTECKLIRNGEVAKIWQGNETCSYQAKQPGVYRVEAYIRYKGLKRGWIFSNPIYISE